MASGSVSTLVAATMQMSGEFSQALILDRLTNSALSEFAIFLYVFAFIGFLINVAVYQNYMAGLWFAIAPGIWSALTYTREMDISVEWRYAGAQVMSSEQILEYSNPNLVQNPLTGPQAGPSTFYILWDKVVSGSIQSLTSVLRAVANDPTTKIFAKMNLQRGMINSQVQDPQIRAALEIAMSDQCTPRIQLSRVNKPGNYLADPFKAEELEAEEVDRMIIALRQLPAETNMLTEPIMRRVCEYNAIWEAWNATDKSGDLSAIMQSTSVTKCANDPWDELVGGVFGTGNKFVSCYDLSRIAWRSLQVEGQLRLRELYARNGAAADGTVQGSEIPASSILPDWEEYLQNQGVLNSLVASYMLKNEAEKLNYLKMRAQTGEIKDNAADAELESKVKAVELAKSSASQAVFFAKSVPYLQGALLYLLALIWPFMALLILVPGMHKGIFTWMGAWVWVKSWDVMFYVVSLMSGVMSEFLMHKSMLHESVALQGKADMSGSISTFAHDTFTKLQSVNLVHEAMFKLFSDVDPQFTEGLLDWVIALTTLSIPVFTGMLFLVGRAGALGAMSSSLSSAAEDATRKRLAMTVDGWLRNAEVGRQTAIRNDSWTGAAIGAGVGSVIAPGMGTAIGGVLGSMIGEKHSSVQTGKDLGATYALYAGSPMVIPPGDVLDPIEIFTGFAGATFAYGNVLPAMGLPSMGLLGEWNSNRFMLTKMMHNATYAPGRNLSGFNYE